MKARRVDSNQSSIVSALRQIPGVSVAVTSGLGEFVDIVAGYQNKNFLFEIKVPGKRKQLKESQKRLRDQWKGQYDVVETLEEILKAIGISK